MPIIPLTCRYCNVKMKKSKSSRPQGEAACAPCRKLGLDIKHGTKNAYITHACRCDACREGARVRAAAYSAKVRDRDGVSPSAQSRRVKRGVDPLFKVQDCAICKEPLDLPSRGAAVPMHSRCRDSAPQWRKVGGENPKIVEFRRRIERAAAGTSGGKRVYVNGACSWCGHEFTSPNGRFCSAKCKASSKFRHRGSGLSFNPSPRERLAIYERDSWICQLCENPSARGSEWGAKWRPTLDHIVPQSKMAVPDHSPSNLRLVHSWCNSARGDGSNMTEAELIARAHEMFQGVDFFAA